MHRCCIIDLLRNLQSLAVAISDQHPPVCDTRALYTPPAESCSGLIGPKSVDQGRALSLSLSLSLLRTSAIYRHPHTHTHILVRARACENPRTHRGLEEREERERAVKVLPRWGYRYTCIAYWSIYFVRRWCETTGFLFFLDFFFLFGRGERTGIYRQFQCHLLPRARIYICGWCVSIHEESLRARWWSWWNLRVMKI